MSLLPSYEESTREATKNIGLESHPTRIMATTQDHHVDVADGQAVQSRKIFTLGQVTFKLCSLATKNQCVIRKDEITRMTCNFIYFTTL